MVLLILLIVLVGEFESRRGENLTKVIPDGLETKHVTG